MQPVVDALLEVLPEGPPFFDKENLSDATERFFVTEIIREKIFLNYDKEIPYATEAGIEEYKEQKDITKIRCTIYVERESQKAIIIGNGGESIKKLGMRARKDIESLLGKKVFLDLQVKVEKDWRKREQMLSRFGYK
jgi:GTP-binding protein Era